jgi:NADH dehydrogenase/NADH:ubiquinone oxidoreductase subunit G
MPPEPGLKVKVNTEKTRRIRKMVLELLLANHDRECTTCERANNCELQALANKMGIKEVRFGKKEEKGGAAAPPWNHCAIFRIQPSGASTSPIWMPVRRS